ncbi:hypothetical protein HBZC1_17010 [Helicobacter bizzozeronii CIII-1]|uniref:Uncharacterized protein n=1 Tax=Helicobacter bizzozeronii (strain CIII-1) TaxID=1002804 RepID=F8KPG3_HELBC|nr:hypothetical protein HBZC1_17010 [Helicobacter bizzozeronii CIII-1]
MILECIKYHAKDTPKNKNTNTNQNRQSLFFKSFTTLAVNNPF